MSSYCQSTLAFSAVALTVAGAAIFLLRKRSKQPGAKTIDVDVPAKIPDGCQKLVLEHYDIWGGLKGRFCIPVGTVLEPIAARIHLGSSWTPFHVDF